MSTVVTPTGQEVIFVRYDPNIQSYVYFTDSAQATDGNVSPVLSHVRPGENYLKGSSLEALPIVNEDECEHDESQPGMRIKDKTYQQFLVWLAKQEKKKVERRDDEGDGEDDKINQESKVQESALKSCAMSPQAQFEHDLVFKSDDLNKLDEKPQPVEILAPITQIEMEEDLIKNNSPTSDEFKDTIEEDDNDNPFSDDDSEPTASTIKENPHFLQSLLVKNLEKFAESLPKIETIANTPPAKTPSEPAVTPDEELTKPPLKCTSSFEKLNRDSISNPVKDDPATKVKVGQTLIHLDQDESSQESDTDIILESKLTISDSHVELTTLKTRSQSSLNRLTPKELDTPQPQYSILSQPSAFAGSPSSLSKLRTAQVSLNNSSASLNLSLSNENINKRPATHTKGKAPIAPPVPPRLDPPSLLLPPPKPPTKKPATSSSESLNQEKVKQNKKPRLFASLAGMFKSDSSSSTTSKDNSKTGDARETKI